MLMVDTYLAKSKVHGIGLFAAKKIKKGTLVWSFHPALDLSISESDLNHLSSSSREQVLNYAYFNEKRGLYILCGDDARFMNHNDDPNIQSIGFNDSNEEGKSFAARDIDKDEELTEDYGHFEKYDRNVECGVF